MANIKINSTPTRVQYTATGGQTVFSYTFPIKEDADLKVYKRAAGSTPADATDLLTLTTDYTVSGANTANGGTITLVVGATLSDIVTIVGDKTIDRNSIYDQSSSLRKEDLNNDFNDNVMYDKQIETIQDQVSIRYNDNESIGPGVRDGNLKLPILNENYFWTGQGNAGDSPDNVVATSVDDALLSSTVDFVIGTASIRFPAAQVLSALANGVMVNNAGTVIVRSTAGTANEITVTDGDGIAGNPTFGLADNPVLPGTGSATAVSGTAGQRPGAPVEGMFRYNSTSTELEAYVQGSWKNMVTDNSSSTITVTQAAHGLSVGNVLRFDGVDYVLAQADSAANAEVAGMINEVVNANTFTLTQNGEVSGLTGLTAGDLLYLDPVTPGALTSVQPVSPNVIAPLMIATTTTVGLFFANTSAGTMSVQDSASIAVTGGTATGLTSLGTAGNGMDVAPGSDTDADLITVGVTGAPTLSWDESEDVFSSSHGLSLGTSNPLTTGTIELGAAADTTLSRASAGDVNIEGNLMYRAGGTDVPVADGGTGASTQQNALINLVSGATIATATVASADKVVIQDADDADNIKTVTAQSIADLAAGVANTALSNLAAVAINTSLISDTDITDDLGTEAIRWNNIYGATLRTGDTAADTLTLSARDVDGASWTNFLTMTANNTPTCVLSGDVTSTTQAASDNSTKIATTAYADAAAAASGANTALSNLASVAINTSLISDTDVTDDIGTEALRWNNIYGATLRTGDTAADTLVIGARDVDGASWTSFVTLTANNTPTCVLSGDITSTTQAPADNSTKLATTAYADAAAAAGGADQALSNLAAVAINTSLTSDTDVTDDLGTEALRWNNIYGATLRTGDTAADTLVLGARDVDGASWTDFITMTANNTPTCSLSGDVTGVTQAASDNSTKLATTAYADAASGAPTDATYITQTPSAGLSAEQALSVLATGIVKNTTTTGVLSIAAEGTDYYGPGGTDVVVADGGTGRSTATAYGVLCGGTTATGAHQSIASVGTAGQALLSNGAAALPTFTALPVEFIAACSDETTALTVSTDRVTFRLPHAMTLTGVRSSLTTAPTGSTFIVDIFENGTSVLGTKLSIDAGEKTSTTAASAATITDSNLADDSEITVDITQIGSTIAGAGLKVTLIGTRA